MLKSIKLNSFIIDHTPLAIHFFKIITVFKSFPAIGAIFFFEPHLAPRLYKNPCLTQAIMNFFRLVNDNSTFRSRKFSLLGCLSLKKAVFFFFVIIFTTYQHLSSHAQLSLAWKKLLLGAWLSWSIHVRLQDLKQASSTHNIKICCFAFIHRSRFTKLLEQISILCLSDP